MTIQVLIVLVLSDGRTPEELIFSLSGIRTFHCVAFMAAHRASERVAWRSFLSDQAIQQLGTLAETGLTPDEVPAGRRSMEPAPLPHESTRTSNFPSDARGTEVVPGGLHQFEGEGAGNSAGELFFFYFHLPFYRTEKLP